jgi:hypothetical protein
VFEDPITAGPDAAGRCAVRRATGETAWLHPSGFTLVGAAAAPAWGAPLVGVYACAAPITIGGYVQASPQAGAMFGLLDGKTYRHFDGGRGHYSYDAASRVLTMTSGPLNGTRYHRQGEKMFSMLDKQGRPGGIHCPLNLNKSLTGRW